MVTLTTPIIDLGRRRNSRHGGDGSSSSVPVSDMSDTEMATTPAVAAVIRSPLASNRLARGNSNSTTPGNGATLSISMALASDSPISAQSPTPATIASGRTPAAAGGGSSTPSAATRDDRPMLHTSDRS
jgi:hypothetical protein